MEDQTCAGVGVRIYRGTRAPAAPCLIYAHGGGWALGDLDTHDAWCRRLASRARCVVIAVDYRQPPEHPYPAALDDVAKVVREVAGHAQAYGVDADRVAVGGDSAGANLAAAVCLRLGTSSIRLLHQLLVLPVVDNRPWRWDSYTEFASGYGMTRADMEWYLEQYLGPRWAEVTDPQAAPIREPQLSGLPAATLLTAECDPLRDEGEAFGVRLRRAGVLVHAHRFPGTFHPFYLHHERLAAAREAVELIADRLRAAFASTGRRSATQEVDPPTPDLDEGVGG